MYGMTILVPSMSFPVDRFGFPSTCLVRACPNERTLLGNGFLVGLCEGDPFL